MASKKRSTNTDRRVNAAERQAAAIRLRRNGWSYDRIAEELGYADKSGAYKAVMAALQATLKEPAEELRTLELKRLDAAVDLALREIDNDNLAAVDKLIRIMERRAALLGLDAPKRVAAEVDGPIELRIRFVDEDDEAPPAAGG